MAYCKEAGRKPRIAMNDQKIEYQVNSAPLTLAAFRNRASALPFDSGNYEPPTPEDVRTLRRLVGWSQADAAKIVGVNFNQGKGSTTIRKWETAKSSSEHRTIPYSAWRLMLLHAGVVSLPGQV